MGNLFLVNSNKFRFFHFFISVCVAVFLIAGLLLVPAIAQTNNIESPKQTIVLDGKKLFEVSDSGSFPADDRAEWINSKLKKVAESPGLLTVEVKEKNGLPTIWLNGGYLLAVTEQDLEEDDRTLQKQAFLWEKELKKNLEQAHQERSAKFLRKTFLQALGVVMGALVFYWGLELLWQHYFPIQSGEEDSHESRPLWHLSLAIARLILLVVTVFYLTNLFPLTRQWSFEFINVLTHSLTAPLFTTSQESYSITKLLLLIVMLVGLVTLSNSLTDRFRSRILPITRMNRNAQELVAAIVKYTTISIGTLVLLQLWGLDLSSLTILASALSVGIGFGFQDIAKNLGSGIVLLFERPIQVGDFVEVGKFMGIVERIGSRSTVIRTLDRVSIIVPNSRFLESEVINWSHHNPISRLKLPVGVAYGSDIELVKTLLLEAAKRHGEVLTTPSPRVVFKGFGDSSLDFELWIWCADPSKQKILTSDLYFRIEALFREGNIEIPFPQRDLHVRSGNLPIELSPELEKLLLQWLNQNGK